MKIFAFVDMHGSLKAFKKIEKQSKKADLIICAGDISIFEQGLPYLLMKLNRFNKPCLIIPGNHESDRDLKKLCPLFENITDLHEKTYIKNNHLFLGYGSGGFSLRDKHFEKLSKKFEKKIKQFRKNKKTAKIILITHAPPYRTKIDSIMGQPCGNKSIKNFINKVKLDIVISGHLHENAGKKEVLGKTLVINPGPFGKIIYV